MGELVNLRRARKAKARDAADAQAAARRARFGRTKDERERARIEAERRSRELAGKKLER